MPSRVLLMIASSDDETMAASRSRSTSALDRSRDVDEQGEESDDRPARRREAGVGYEQEADALEPSGRCATTSAGAAHRRPRAGRRAAAPRRHRSAVRRASARGAHQRVVPELRPAAPELGGGLVVEGEHTLGSPSRRRGSARTREDVGGASSMSKPNT